MRGRGRRFGWVYLCVVLFFCRFWFGEFSCFRIGRVGGFLRMWLCISFRRNGSFLMRFRGICIAM